MANRDRDQRIAAARRFNRFYTRQIGVLRKNFLDSPYSLGEARVIYEIASDKSPTASEIEGLSGGREYLRVGREGAWRLDRSDRYRSLARIPLVPTAPVLPRHSRHPRARGFGSRLEPQDIPGTVETLLVGICASPRRDRVRAGMCPPSRVGGW